MGYWSLAVVALTLGCEKIIAEPLAEIHSKVAESAFALTIDSEMAQNAIPFLIFLTALLLEVGEEVHAQLLFVEEVKLLVEKLLEATATDSLRLFDAVCGTSCRSTDYNSSGTKARKCSVFTF